MPTLRFASLCVLTSIIFFSCNNKKNADTTVSNNVPAQQYDTVSVLPDEPVNINAYNAVYIESATQHFTAPAKKISIITAKKGLKVTINPAVLEAEDGTPVYGNIKVRVIEITNNDELFKSNAATVSDGRLLVSGGSYFVEMESDGKKLQIKKGNNLQLEFPKLKDSEMELFYGNRNVDGDMNWTKANEPLEFNRGAYTYTPFTPPFPDTVASKPYKSKYYLFESLQSKVVYLNTKMTVKEMVDMLQKKGVDKDIDSLTVDVPFHSAGWGYYIAPAKRYRVMPRKEIKVEQDSFAQISCVRAEQAEANRKYAEEWQRASDANLLTGQLQKYYSPAGVTKLGWINCDRFYNSPQNINIECEIPITFEKPKIQYFLIYKSFNGLMQGTMKANDDSKLLLSGLPLGENVVLVAFTKSNGELFECKQEFVIQKNKTVQLNFKSISVEEMTKMFGVNVRI